MPRFVGTDVEQDEILELISTAASRSFKPVGHSSVVLRMRTVARVTVAMRVRTREIQDGYRYEVAAYRIARLLGLDNVPPAIFRRVTWNEISRRFHDDMLDRRASLRRKVLWDDDGSAPGAAVYWVKGMRSAGLESRAGWRSWVRDGEIPEGRAALAQDLSTMAVFDLLIGNWDRFSGGNLPMDSERRRALLRDNDRAFSTPLFQRRYEKLLAGVTDTARFSRSLYRRLEALDEAAIRAELQKDPSHENAPLLNALQIAELLVRRDTILSYIAAMIEARGEAQVLFFP
ncbi:MAG: hypothetical protein ACN4G0_19365 [Polyangiales bacterium]